MSRYTSALLSCLLCAGSAQLAHAQDAAPPTVQLTEEQITLNNRAVKRMAETPPKLEEAIRLTQAALVVGEKGDLLYLTLGRAFQLQGECARAEEEFARALEARRVEGLPQKYIRSQITLYRKELAERCEGTLMVQCEPQDLDLTLDGGALVCQQATPLAAGSYEVIATNPLTGSSVSVQAVIVGMQTTTTTIKLAGPTPVATSAVPEAPADIAGEPELSQPVRPVPAAPGERAVIIKGLVGAPLGYCRTRVESSPMGLPASATDGAICYGVRAEASFIKPLGEHFALGLAPSAQALMAHGLGEQGREPVTLRGFDADLGLQALTWSRRIGLEVAGGVRARRAVVDGQEAGDAMALLLGPGVLLNFGELMGGVDTLGVSMRWRPLLDAGLSARAVVGRGPVAVWFAYESWEGDLSEQGFTHRAEQLTLGAGWSWGD